MSENLLFLSLHDHGKCRKSSNRWFSGLNRRSCTRLGVSCPQPNALDDGIDLRIARLRNFEQSLDFISHVENDS